MIHSFTVTFIEQNIWLVWSLVFLPCMSHHQRDLNVIYLRSLNFRSDFCSFKIDEEYYFNKTIFFVTYFNVYISDHVTQCSGSTTIGETNPYEFADNLDGETGTSWCS
jgi:hypothetical protein